ncbi:hypothetical protein EGO58_08410 [Limosilactobacillus reuteri]|uniref:hypothetical protein n=1 Tax=Limosilactobacillus reuteri TaxID=1598 RepID=UPI000F4E8F0C|nr:hypothetical protein [Limosilactobacillus reuteri]MCC4487023.1 hypothetical protein [Limosilactobacillus reuteri]MDZ5436942.1 hypothetical protein [Limosilactobacillus reuteri]ROV62449.1 hypothetical protein EGO58_08410 [Limosilactobacillus reuteri]UFK69215.1 hypothetical protein IVR12_02326 [Limosilactobacillus reuteri]
MALETVIFAPKILNRFDNQLIATLFNNDESEEKIIVSSRTCYLQEKGIINLGNNEQLLKKIVIQFPSKLENLIKSYLSLNISKRYALSFQNLKATILLIEEIANSQGFKQDNAPLHALAFLCSKSQKALLTFIRGYQVEGNNKEYLNAYLGEIVHHVDSFQNILEFLWKIHGVNYVREDKQIPFSDKEIVFINASKIDDNFYYQVYLLFFSKQKSQIFFDQHVNEEYRSRFYNTKGKIYINSGILDSQIDINYDLKNLSDIYYSLELSDPAFLLRLFSMTKLKKILDLTFNDIKLALFTKPIYMLKDRYIRIRLQENVVEIIKVKDGKLISNSISLIEFFNSLSKKEYHQTKDDRVIDNGNEAMTGEFGDYGASAPELNGDGWYNG